MSQTAYTQDPAVAIEGLPADSSFDKDKITAIASETIDFGLWVARTTGGPADDRPPRAVRPTTAGEVTGGVGLGIVIAETTIEQAATPVGFIVDQVMAVMHTGRIWVLAEDAVAFGGAVFIRHVATGGERLGASRSDADGTDATAVPGATFRSTTTGAGFAIVELHGII